MIGSENLSGADAHELATARNVLLNHGVTPGTGGYDLNTLAAAIYARGWGYGIDYLEGSFRAEILPLATNRLQAPVHRIAWSMETALVLALAHALVQSASPYSSE